ncbi:hypothetical protein AVEN_90669-1 [Araneus ventricosus]|uniref:Secreted protein n=1 Tax=Araneus ventricosus TaxID=182803 RepID=A0A4Y2F4A4_ARAVE|nr:hypothetical protein AVEN_90669-1 [Araneus ventricosus]
MLFQNKIHFSLVALTFRLSVTRGLIWDGPRNFESQSNDKDGVSAGPTLSRTAPVVRLLTAANLTCTAVLRVIVMQSGLKSTSPVVGALPRGHRDHNSEVNGN